MKIKNTLPQSIIVAAVAMLSPFIPDLSPTRLIAALQSYDSEAKEQDNVNARPRQSLTLKDACFILRLSRPTIYRMNKRGEIKLLKIGNSTRISAQEIDRLLSN